MTLEEAIDNVLRKYNQGISAKDIAIKIGSTKADVNKILYKKEGNKYEKLPYTFDWRLVDKIIQSEKGITNDVKQHLNSQSKKDEDSSTSINQAELVLNTFFNGNKKLIELFKETVIKGPWFLIPILRADSILLIGLAHPGHKYLYYIRKKGNSFHITFPKRESYSFKVENKDRIMGDLKDTPITSLLEYKKERDDLAISEYSLDYLFDKNKGANTDSVKQVNKNSKNKKESTPEQIPLIDYNSTLLVTDSQLFNRIKLKAFFLLKTKPWQVCTFTAYKTEQKNTYYITRELYKDFQKWGIPCTKIIDTDKTLVKGDGKWEHLDDQSLIRACGYSTEEKAGLTSKERQCILEKVIENHLWTPRKVISHLNWCIEMHPQEMYRVNRARWEADVKYIREKYRVV